MTKTKAYRQAAEKIRQACPYSMTQYDQWNYDILHQIRTLTRGGKNKKNYNDVIIMGDTETSKDHLPKNREDQYENHVCAWTISIRAYEHNLVTLYGTRPTEMVQTIHKLQKYMPGDITIIYFHNLGYDWTFLRRFLMVEFGTPTSQLNIKPYYPIFVEFNKNLIFKDSLILAQKSLDKWGIDLDVEHKKAGGKWDYDLIRHQGGSFTDDELEYIEHDTLCGVECLNAMMEALHKKIYSLPYTNTGIVRGTTQDLGKKNRARQFFQKVCNTWASQMISEMLFHGGFTHANRYIIGWVYAAICMDFASSYPYCLMLKMPSEKFMPYKGQIPAEEILELSEKYAFKFLLQADNVRLKDKKYPMPMIQGYKCLYKDNAVIDNGRILSASCINIWYNEYDLKLFMDQYDYDKIYISDIEYSYKDYLPRWFTDMVYELFKDKTKLKGGDPVNYAIKKGMLNSCYGMTVQHPVKINIDEDYQTGEYHFQKDYDPEKEYDKYLKKFTSILPYDWGCWVTSAAMYNLFELSKCIADDGIWLYSDTDSIYATKWDMDKVEDYNQKVKAFLTERGYPGVEHEGRTYWLGVAEVDGVYSEFKTMGAKRYACRYTKEDKKHPNELKITVAGVPKKGVECLQDNIDNFRPGLVFDGEVSGKKQHKHFYSEIHTDKYGNEIGDSIDLSPCDYLLDDIFNNAAKAEMLFTQMDIDEVFIKVFDEEGID